MTDEPHSFSIARVRLEEIVSQVRKKDTSLEKSLDLLEEGVRLANACTELIDHADWTVGEAPTPESADSAAGGQGAGASEDASESGAPSTEFPSELSTEDVEAADGANSNPAHGSDEDGTDSEDFGDADHAWADEDPAHA